MSKEDVVEKVVKIPGEFHARSDVSFYLLVEQSGYFENPDEAAVRDFESYLSIYPMYVVDWLQWSNDKRNLGWYFTKGKKGEFVVGHLPGRKDVLELIYSDGIKACAEYIKKELEDLEKS